MFNVSKKQRQKGSSIQRTSHSVIQYIDLLRWLCRHERKLLLSSCFLHPGYTTWFLLFLCAHFCCHVPGLHSRNWFWHWIPMFWVSSKMLCCKSNRSWTASNSLQKCQTTTADIYGHVLSSMNRKNKLLWFVNVPVVPQTKKTKAVSTC